MSILAKISKYIPNVTSTQSKIASICADIGCCSRCTLRYLGIRAADLHRELLPKGQAVTFLTPNTTATIHQPKEDVCPACLGFLQMNFIDIAKNGVQLMLKENYDLYEKTFNLAIKLPPQLIIRHTSVVHHIKKKLSDQEDQEFPDFVEVKEVFKYLARDEFEKISQLDFDVKSPFAYTLYLQHEETNEDYVFLTEIPHSKFIVKKSKKKGKTIYQGASLDKVTKAVSLITGQDYLDHKQSPPNKVKTLPVVEESFLMHTQIYVAGRYCKLKRHISNSPWIIGGKRLTEDSCEELISQFIIPVFQNDSNKFSSSGREDADVLMLGRGRPFYFELINPRKTFASDQEMAELQRKINQGTDGKIKVYDLQVCTR
jgi:tRNA pseudouridine synthase 10